MSLREQQNLLARLYTDSVLREKFFSAPIKIGKKFKLTENEINEIAAMAAEELNFFAESLYWKRLREVEKFLPLTRKVLDIKFKVEFRDFSQNYIPQTVKKHLEDAIEFCMYLNGTTNDLLIKDITAFERAKLLFSTDNRKLIIVRSHYDIKQIFKKISRNEPVVKAELRKKNFFAIWLKIGKIRKHYYF